MQFAEFEYFYDIIYPRYSIYPLFCKSWIKCISTDYNVILNINSITL